MPTATIGNLGTTYPDGSIFLRFGRAQPMYPGMEKIWGGGLKLPTRHFHNARSDEVITHTFPSGAWTVFPHDGWREVDYAEAERIKAAVARGEQVIQVSIPKPASPAKWLLPVGVGAVALLLFMK